MERKINLNSEIKVKLTKFGIIEFEKYEKTLPSVDRNGYIKIQMWKFINIFGPSIYKKIPASDIQFT